MKTYIQSLGRTGLFAGFALLLGGLGIVASRMNQPAVPVPVPILYDVPVAIVDLQVGRLITKSDFYVQKFTMEQKKAAGFKNPHYSQGKDLTGRIVRTPILKNEYFTMDSLYPEGTGPSISEKLRPGMRAVMIPVNAASITELTTPDSFVDVLFRPAASPALVGGVTLAGGRILECTQVLAVNLKWYSQTLPAIQQGQAAGAGVTLSVTPEQAEMLKSLEPLGTFSLTAAPDAGTAPTGEIPSPERMKKILGLNDPPPEVIIAPTMEIVRGGGISRIPLDSQIGVSIPSGADSSLIPSLEGVPLDLLPVPPGPEQFYFPDSASNQPARGRSDRLRMLVAPTRTASKPTVFKAPIPSHPTSSRNFGGKAYVSTFPSAGRVASKVGTSAPRKLPTPIVNQPKQVAFDRTGTSVGLRPASGATSHTVASGVLNKSATRVTPVQNVDVAVAAQKTVSARPPAPVVNRRTQTSSPRNGTPPPQVSAVWMRPAADQRSLAASSAFKSIRRR